MRAMDHILKIFRFSAKHLDEETDNGSCLRYFEV